MSALNEAARKALEALMQHGRYEYQSDFARRYFAKGKTEGEAKGEAKGKVEAVLQVLAARGLVLSVEQRERILVCRDVAVLGRWLDRAVGASSADDLFV